MRFENRKDAGRQLAQALAKEKENSDTIVLALPRGGVPVAFEIALALSAPLDVYNVRKIGVPGQEELAMGAIESGGEIVLNQELVDELGIPPEVIETVAGRERAELKRREWTYRRNREPVDVKDRSVILVDDGLATGATMLVAVKALRRQQPGKIIVAVPVSPPSTCEEIGAIVDEIICLRTPEPFLGLSVWYEDFRQTSDDEVKGLLEAAGDPLRRTAG